MDLDLWIVQCFNFKRIYVSIHGFKYFGFETDSPNKQHTLYNQGGGAAHSDQEMFETQIFFINIL